MPLYNMKWDGVGFTTEKKMTEQEFSPAMAACLTKELQEVGQLPPGVVRIVQANVSPDGCEAGEWKVFVSVELVIEASSERAVEMLSPPEDFLLTVADKMVDGDADAQYGIRGTFEVLEVYPADDELVAHAS